MTTAHLDFSVIFPYRKLTNWGERVLAVSEDIKDYLLKNYKSVKEENIRITVNAIDTERFSPEINADDVKKELGLDIQLIKQEKKLDVRLSLMKFLIKEGGYYEPPKRKI